LVGKNLGVGALIDNNVIYEIIILY
jgi:hypothetical protein